MRVALLSNVNLDLVSKALRRPSSVWSPPGYGEWVIHTFEQGAGALRDFGPEQILVILDGAALVDGVDDDSVHDELNRCMAHVERLAGLFPHVRLVVSTLDFPARRIRPASAGTPEERWAASWRSAAESLAHRIRNVAIFDLERLITDVGRSGFYSAKMWYLGGQPYAMSSVKLLAGALDVALRRLAIARKKVMIVDLDNTLWGGVVGEDGPAGLVIGPSGPGAAYRDVQRRLKELSRTGVLLAAVSKNERRDAIAAFEKNQQMVLDAEDFVAIVATWDPKPEGIRGLAAQLNLGLDSFVFLDDNPVEREAIRQAIPEVTVLDFPRDVAALPRVVEVAAAEHFWIDRLTAEDESKTSQYQQEAKREDFRATADNMDDYLRQLEVKIMIGEVDDARRSRTAQLTQKTNQFNVLTQRHSAEELGRLRELPGHHTFAVSVSDRFGDSGQVGVVMVEVDGTTATVSNLLMSCRVMGRAIEDATFAAIEKHLVDQGVATILAAYERTERNTPVAGLFDRLGFDRVEESGDRTSYRRSTGAPAPQRRELHVVIWEDR